jgi:hypothetical protein
VRRRTRDEFAQLFQLALETFGASEGGGGRGSSCAVSRTIASVTTFDAKRTELKVLIRGGNKDQEAAVTNLKLRKPSALGLVFERTYNDA